jgi:hypothetical protein
MKRTSVVFLIVANTIPLTGVLFFEWSLFAVIFLYWFENIVLGFFNVLRMLRAEGGGNDEKFDMELNGQTRRVGRAAYALFFLMHYGIFTAVHGVFVFTLFGPFDIAPTTFIFAVIALLVSHGASHMFNFIGKKEYMRVSANNLFIQPYLRIFVIHLTIIFGGMAITALGTPIGALVIMIALKIAMDVIAHLMEHYKFGIDVDV